MKGKIKKGSTVESVGDRGLRLLKSTITDGTATVFLRLWKKEIDSVQDSKVYMIDVRVSFSYMTKTLATMQKSLFFLLEFNDMEEVEESVALQMLEEPNETTLLVPSIRSVEVSKYHTCIHCHRKLSQGMRAKIVKCMRCSRRMRLADCNMDISSQIAVQVDDSETQLVLAELLNKENVIESSSQY